ncbi:MAG: glycogen debranching protein GlgX [bacterium]|nr:glycogen debranching protein GlgX [bacterium]
MQWTDTYEGYKIRPGFFAENGTMVVPGGVNFTVFSRHATSCELLLFRRKVKEPFAVIPFPSTYRIGYVYSMIIFDLDIGEFEYAYRFDGPYNPKKGLIFNKEKVVLDPYAKAVTGQSKWGEKDECGNLYHARVVVDEFDWDDSKQPEIPMEDLVIYELHVRGFTRHESSGVSCPGTFAGLMEKIPYLKQLGVNAVELMPIFEFDEMKDYRMVNGKQLMDYWGYNPVSFFAPNTSYASSLEYNHEGNELKNMICELNSNGIEVILDVVFNHTAEGNEYGPYISYKGVDNNVYYMLTPDGYYYNFSGCGNTLNCNHPVVQRMILDCLRYWVTEYRVDGFRFDLASILGRNEDGTPMENPPLLQALAYDPVLGKVKLIAEAWDAGGMYQVGSFPSWQRWSEWNGKYRDDMRRFLKGDGGLERMAANRILGSLDLYDPAIRGDGASVNFITCHDGFTLWDLYSYNSKHNEENGWCNEDGDDNNNSWNCGVEGETDKKDILVLRKKLVKNACIVLLASRGIPMLLAGDEFGNTQFGNNNAYCQDNDISWLDWSLLTANHDIFKFYKFMLSFRKQHPIIRRNTEETSLRFPLTSLHGLQPWYYDETNDHHYIGVLYAGRAANQNDDFIYIAINTYWESRVLTLPKLNEEFVWTLCMDTEHDMVNGFEAVEGQAAITPRTVLVFVAVQKKK